jgi:cytoskeletal protein RodZ
VRYKTSESNNPSSKKPNTIAAVRPRRTAYLQPQLHLFLALVGTLIAVLSVALFLGREAQAQTTQPVNDLAAPVQEKTTQAQQESAPEPTSPTQDQTTQQLSDKSAPVEEKGGGSQE